MTTINLKPFHIILLLVVVTILAYGNTLRNSFVYDDFPIIVENLSLRRLNNLGALFTSDYFRVSRELTYRPVVTLSYFIDYVLWQLKPFGYHLTNLILHTFNGILLYFIFRNLLRRQVVALVAALLFVTHPITTEAVNGISFREDLLALAFSLLSFIGYWKFSCSDSRGWSYPALCWGSFFLALFSKEMAVSLPLLFLLFELSFRRKPFSELKKTIPVYAGIFLLLGFYLIIRFLVLPGPEEVEFEAASFYPRMLTMSRALFFYLKMLLLPLNLSAEYSFPVANSFFDPRTVVSVLLLAVMLIAGILSRRRFPEVFFGIWWFFLTLLPVANIVPLFNPVAERYLYFPAAGFCLILALLGEGVYRRLPVSGRPLVFVFLTVLLAFYTERTIKRNRDWKDYITFCRRTLLNHPESRRFRKNLGMIYILTGRLEEAIEEFRKLLELNPQDASLYNHLGILYRKKGLHEEAVEAYRNALKIEPNYAEVYGNLGELYLNRGMITGAIAELETALRINPDLAMAHNNLGVAYSRKNMVDKAIAEYKRALQIEPEYTAARGNLAAAYIVKGRFDDAISECRKILQVEPDNAEIHYYLGLAYNQSGRVKQAETEYLAALRINPNIVPAYHNLGTVYFDQGKYEQAKRCWEQALRIDPDFQPSRERLDELTQIRNY